MNTLFDLPKLQAAYRTGAAFGFPTETVYALAANPWLAAGSASLYALKQRSHAKPIALLAASPEAVCEHVIITPAFTKLWKHFGPAPLTYVLERHPSSSLPDSFHSGTTKIGVRIPAHPLALAILQELGGLVLATSANISGATSARGDEDLDPQIRASLAYYVPGAAMLGTASTVIDATCHPPTLLREGSLPCTDVLAALKE